MFKKTLLLSLATSALLATNGVNMIGTDTVSRSMGGTGVAFYSHAASAMHKNVALLGDIGKDEFQFDMTYFNASVSNCMTDGNPIGMPEAGQGCADSQNMIDTNFIPSMAYATRIDENMVFGMAMIGAAGMAVNYEGARPQRQLKSSMMLMKIIPGVSYRQGNVTFGFAPVLGLGSMSLNYDDTYIDPSTGKTYASQGQTKPQSDREGLFGTNIGGDSLVPALGFTVGIDIKVTEKLRVAASYNSALSYTYSDVANFRHFGPHGMVYMADEFLDGGLRELTDVDIQDGTIHNLLKTELSKVMGDEVAEQVASATLALMPDGSLDSSFAATDPSNLDDLTLEQPWEIAVGFAYDVTPKMTVTADYRYIDWASTEGYGTFGWESQHVFALGAEYRAKNYSVRFGYNYANAPINDVKGEFGSLLTDVQGKYVFDQALSMLNMVGFPAIATTHFTAGLGYAINEDIDLDFAFMYSPENTVTRSGTLLPLDVLYEGLSVFDYAYETKMQQFTLSGGINYRF